MSRGAAGFVCSLLLCLGAPGLAVASTPAVLSSDPSAIQVDVLNGVVVWAADNRVFVRRAGVTRSTARMLHWDAADPFEGVRSGQLDLGIDAHGRVVAAFDACTSGCRPEILDVVTMRLRPLRIPVPRGCSLGPAALWRTRVAYGVTCRGGTTSIQVRERGRSHRIGPKGWPDQNPMWSSISRVDLRGSAVLAFVNTGEVTLLDSNRACRQLVDARYNDGQVPGYIRPLSPHLAGGLITWGRNSFHTDETRTDRLDGSALATVGARTGCALARSQSLQPGGAGPVDWAAIDILHDGGGEATSVALGGSHVYATVKNRGLVTFTRGAWPRPW